MIFRSKNKQIDAINQTLVVKLNQITFTFLHCEKEEKRTLVSAWSSGYCIYCKLKNKRTYFQYRYAIQSIVLKYSYLYHFCPFSYSMLMKY